MRTSSILRLTVLALAFATVAPGLIKGDDVYGRIRGTVTDPSGAVIGGAKVTATNVDTGISKSVQSGADGSYEFLQLAAPATYKVTVAQTGFSTFEAQNIPLGLNQIYVLNMTLQLGSVNQKITVETNPAQVETTSMELGATLKSSTVVDLPLNGRNWVQLQATLPGVVAGSDRFGDQPNFATSGSRSQANDFRVNGTDANDFTLNTPLIIPNPDAIAEVRVITNTINPEYGRNGGAILNATTKSGTNQFHGDGFEFYRDTSLNTRNFFLPEATVFHQNQFGGTIGGPIRKDKAFFFFSYQGTRNRSPQAGQSGTAVVFTQDQRNGDFPDLATSTGTSPFPLVGESGATFPAGTPYSEIFPSGHIPAADFNSVSANLLNKDIPLPNFGTNVFSFNPTQTVTDNHYVFRVDYNFNQSNTVWAYGFINPNTTVDPLSFNGGDLPGFGEIDPSQAQHYTLAWTHTFSGTMLNEVRFGYNRLNLVASEPQTKLLPSSLGFTGINPQFPDQASAPLISIPTLFSLGFSIFGPQPRISNTYELTDNFSKVVGRHTLKFGFDMRRYQVFNPFLARNNGVFNFQGGGTYSTQDPGADFLLGIPDSYVQESGNVINARTQTYYTYAQDQFKLKPNLTLTYGVGWEVDTPIVQLYNGGIDVNCFRPGEQSTVFPTAPVGLVFPGDPSCPPAGYSNRPAHFGPRFGFAYSPGGSGKTSIRGGFGVYFNRPEEELTLENLGAPPFFLASTGIGDVGGSPSFAHPFVDISTGASVPNKFPFASPQKGAAVDFTQLEPFSINVFDPNTTIPYSMNYNLTVERQLKGDVILSVAYVGLQGRKLTGVYELNPAGQNGANPVCLATPGCNPFNLSSTVPQTFRYPQVNSLGQLVYGSIGQIGTYVNSNYNALQVSAEKHLSHGLQFRAAYTWSHSLDDGSSFEDLSSGFRASDPFNRHNDYGDSIYDARQRFVLSYSYYIPSVRHFSAFQRLPSRLTDGWRITGITTFQSGFPISLFDSSDNSDTCNASFSFYGCPDRPNAVAPQVILNPRTGTAGTPPNLVSNIYFSPASFPAQSPGVLGNSGRNFFHGPGINNFDFALFKDTRVTESKMLELRFEFFNLFNHTQFNPVEQVNGAIADASAPNFGAVLGALSSRVIQLGAKFYF
jgi:hypothetical protein